MIAKKCDTYSEYCTENNEIRFYIREEPYGFLSNFWKMQMTVGKLVYPTNEHYYQSQKANTERMAEWIRKAPTAYQAMIAGRNLKPNQIRPEWNGIKTDIMLNGLRVKFSNENLRIMLNWTGNAILIEDSPTDTYWGGKLEGSKNMLGKLLMKVRNETSTG